MFLCLEKKEAENKTLHMLRSDNHKNIIDYIEHLKNLGYEIIDFPPVEKNRRTYNTNILVEKIII
jgi:hypothetical protein